ncbi:hypothetical protein MMC21_002154 [Puttea exsequens]|nr:hypothetical protein [Puttea exsequens]
MAGDSARRDSVEKQNPRLAQVEFPLRPVNREPQGFDDNYTSDDYCDFPSSISSRPSQSRSRAKKTRRAGQKIQDSKPLLRPAKDILSRIKHDPSLSEADYVIGYQDRHSLEPMELDVSIWKDDVTDEEWIPQHRIWYFRNKRDQEGTHVWDRETRLDKVFGSGVVELDEGGNWEKTAAESTATGSMNPNNRKIEPVGESM